MHRGSSDLSNQKDALPAEPVQSLVDAQPAFGVLPGRSEIAQFTRDDAQRCAQMGERLWGVDLFGQRKPGKTIGARGWNIAAAEGFMGDMIAENLTPGGKLAGVSDGELFRVLRHSVDKGDAKPGFMVGNGCMV